MLRGGKKKILCDEYVREWSTRQSLRKNDYSFNFWLKYWTLNISLIIGLIFLFFERLNSNAYKNIYQE